MIDIFNRTIFDQLGFHDAFITRSFETRFVLRFLFPFWFCYVNAINAAKSTSTARCTQLCWPSGM
jgi:hypothetical protein